jgi:hypothetical protein
MRDYDPTTGRYLQADPLGLVDGASVYGYVKQNPMRYIDPNGKLAVLPSILVGIAIGGVAGYLQTGCLEGAAIGAVTGGLFGYFGHVLKAGVIGSGYLGAGNSALSQILAFEFADGCGCATQSFNHRVFWSTVLFTGLGSGLGTALGRGAGPAVSGAPGGDVLSSLLGNGLGGLVGEGVGY